MKLSITTYSVALASLTLLTPNLLAQDDGENRFSFSGRFGFNISAKFHGVALTPSGSGGTRTTPNGDPYNYDNGYVLTDTSGNAGDQTWYWGYDDSSKQISGNTILMSKTTGGGSSRATSDDADPAFGGEVVYSRHLGEVGRFKYGFELAGNYMNVSINDNRRVPVAVTRTTDAYPFTDSTLPPIATPDAPYQGSFEGPGFLIGATPVSSTTDTSSDGSSSTGHRNFDANVWGLRIGPYLEFPVSQKFSVSVSGGFAGAAVDAKADWSESLTVAGVAGPKVSGKGTDAEFLLGAYVAGNAAYALNEHWSVVGSVQFQYLQDYAAKFGGRTVSMDLSHGIFVTIGVGYSF